MPAPDPLDLSALDPAKWYVIVEGCAYGPYTLGQMQGFIDEGRVTPASLVGDAKDAPYRVAADIQALAPFLDAIADHTAPAEATNYVIIARITDENEAIRLPFRRAVSSALNGLGQFAETLPGTYVLRARHRLSEIRRTLLDALGPDAQVLIVEAADGRLGWLGLTSAADTHIRSVWNAREADS